MKKIKITLIAMAVLVGTFGAVASSVLKAPCEAEQQYLYSSTAGFQPVSDTYYCLQGGSGNHCTYYKSQYVPVVYTVCVYGVYTDPAR